MTTPPDPTPPRAETVTLPRETVERLISIAGVIGLCKAVHGYPNDYWCGRAETLEYELVAACRPADWCDEHGQPGWGRVHILRRRDGRDGEGAGAGGVN